MNTLINLLFRRTKAGDPVRRVADAGNLDTVYSILEDLQGVGCRIDKPTEHGGRGWRVVIDGKSTDEQPPDGKWPFKQALPCDADTSAPVKSITARDNDGKLPAVRLYGFRSGARTSSDWQYDYALMRYHHGDLGDVIGVSALSGETNPPELEVLPMGNIVQAGLLPDVAYGWGSGYLASALSAQVASRSVKIGADGKMSLAVLSALQAYSSSDAIVVKAGGYIRYRSYSSLFDLPQFESSVIDRAIPTIAGLLEEDSGFIGSLPPGPNGLALASGTSGGAWDWSPLTISGDLSGFLELMQSAAALASSMADLSAWLHDDWTSGTLSGDISSLNSGLAWLSANTVTISGEVSAVHSAWESLTSGWSGIDEDMSGIVSADADVSASIDDLSQRISALEAR